MHAWRSPTVPALPRLGAAAPVLVHDSTTHALVEAGPGATATLYACGITPYDATHLGHANTYLAFDLLQRAWLDAGKTVVYTSNVTDVDDPLLDRATATGVDWRDLALEQTELYRTDMTALRMLPPSTWTGAVESIPAVTAAVTALLDAGAAYWVDRDVYADLSADPAFGTVAGLDAETMCTLFAERGGDPDRPGKRHPLDPALWRGVRPGDPSWDGGPLGPGRPGWHIECAVIARDGLGLPFDVQGGGADLLFPHHEMSTSHARLLGASTGSGGPGGGAHVHMHAGLLAYDGHKMSKSRGNLVFVSGLLGAGTDPMTIRLALLGHHYREEWEWTEGELSTAQRRLDRWTRATLNTSDDGEPASAVLDEVRAALAADLDAPRALAAVDRWAANPGGDAHVVVAAVDALLGVDL